MALALRHRAHEAPHLAAGLDAYGRGVVTGDLRHAAMAERSGSHARELRVRGDPDSAEPSVRLPLLLAEPRIVDGLEGALEGAGGVAAVDHETGGRRERKLLRAHEVASADGDGVEPGPARDHVDHPLA